MEDGATFDVAPNAELGAVPEEAFIPKRDGVVVDVDAVPNSEVGAAAEDEEPPNNDVWVVFEEDPPNSELDGAAEPKEPDPKEGLAVAEVAGCAARVAPAPPNEGLDDWNAEPNGFVAVAVVVAGDGDTPNKLLCWPLAAVDPNAPVDPPNREVLTGCCELKGTIAPVFGVSPVVAACAVAFADWGWADLEKGLLNIG